MRYQIKPSLRKFEVSFTISIYFVGINANSVAPSAFTYVVQAIQEYAEDSGAEV